MSKRTMTLAILLAISCSLWLIRHLIESESLYVCDLQGVELYVTHDELRGEGSLIFGRLQDGREVAVGRYGVERCRRWLKGN